MADDGQGNGLAQKKDPPQSPLGKGGRKTRTPVSGILRVPRNAIHRDMSVIEVCHRLRNVIRMKRTGESLDGRSEGDRTVQAFYQPIPLRKAPVAHPMRQRPFRRGGIPESHGTIVDRTGEHFEPHRTLAMSGHRDLRAVSRTRYPRAPIA